MNRSIPREVVERFIDKYFMLPGVTSIGIGLLEQLIYICDQRTTYAIHKGIGVEVIHIYHEKRIRKRIPNTFEGYYIVQNVSGKIRAF